MKISDKELDDLFSQKLNNLEIEPDAAVWENITAKLGGKPKKKSIIPALRIAASVIVVLSAGVFLLSRNDQPVKNQIQQKVVKQKAEQVQPEIKQIENSVDKKDMLLLTAKNKAIKEARPAKRNDKIQVLKLRSNPQPEEVDNSSNQTIAQNKPELTQSSENANINTSAARTALVPDASVSLKAPAEVETPAAIVKTAVLAAANNKPAKAKHKGIRNMGDLVNLVMAKVDKRSDKLIEFSDSDDGDESNVTGINLGIIGIKKEK